MNVDYSDQKEAICEIGRRLYQKGFAAANDGNISVRVGENEVLCTPTLHSKGYLQSCDIVMIDLEGHQIAGEKKCTSEVLLHLEIYRRRSDVKSVLHCHPPHATAFAMTGTPIPRWILPEVEVFLGEVPTASYCAPGSQKFAETIVPFIDTSTVILLANHGTVAVGECVERAFWWTEIIDAYCRMLILAKQLGLPQQLSSSQQTELLEIRKQWGFAPPYAASQKTANHTGYEMD